MGSYYSRTFQVRSPYVYRGFGFFITVPADAPAPNDARPSVDSVDYYAAYICTKFLCLSVISVHRFFPDEII